MNKKIIIIAAALMFIIFFPTFSWKKYSNHNASFSFRYPPNMKICENFDNSYVAIIDNKSYSTKVGAYTALNCDNFTMENSKYLVVTDLNIETTESDIKTWIEKLPRENPIKETELPMAGLIPVNGMAEWKFISTIDSNLVANNDETSIAEVSYFANDTTLSKQYLILSSGRLYHLNTSPIAGVRTWPITLILKTLEFK